MKIRIRKKRKIQFTDKKHPLAGIISTLIAFVSLFLMIGLFIHSGMEKGNGGLMYGYLGVLNLVLSLAEFILSLRCYKKEEVYMLTATIGSVLNGIIVILFLVLYFWGTL